MHAVRFDELPDVVRRHVAACRDHDVDAFMATFGEGALVNDIRREFLGRDAIRAWAQAEIIATKVTLQAEASFLHVGQPIVRFAVDGTYDKSDLPNPLILTYYFTIDAGCIGQLVIVHNASSAVVPA